MISWNLENLFLRAEPQSNSAVSEKHPSIYDRPTCCENWKQGGHQIKQRNVTSSMTTSSAFSTQRYWIPPTGTPQRNELIQIKITSEAIFKLLGTLKENKAMGHDQIGSLVLKQCSHTFSLLLAMIFQTCQQGYTS